MRATQVTWVVAALLVSLMACAPEQAPPTAAGGGATDTPEVAATTESPNHEHSPDADPDEHAGHDHGPEAGAHHPEQPHRIFFPRDGQWVNSDQLIVRGLSPGLEVVSINGYGQETFDGQFEIVFPPVDADGVLVLEDVHNPEAGVLHQVTVRFDREAPAFVLDALPGTQIGDNPKHRQIQSSPVLLRGRLTDTGGSGPMDVRYGFQNFPVDVEDGSFEVPLQVSPKEPLQVKLTGIDAAQNLVEEDLIFEFPSSH